MFFKYHSEELALYTDPITGQRALMQVISGEVKRCHGDILPHCYWSGRILYLEFDHKKEALKPVPGPVESYIFNVREKRLRKLDDSVRFWLDLPSLRALETKQIDLSALNPLSNIADLVQGNDPEIVNS